jgi:hypothetical protein
VEDLKRGPPRMLDHNIAGLGGYLRKRRALPGGLREVTNAEQHQRSSPRAQTPLSRVEAGLNTYRVGLNTYQ